MMRALIAFCVRLFTGVRLLPVVPHGGGVAIYFANHASHLDFAVVWAALPACERERASPAAAEDYWGGSALRRSVACGIFQAVLIPRSGITRVNHPLDRLGAVLEQGRSVIIFPEGTRRQDGEVGEFKAGLYHLARRYPGIPLVPVHLENLSRILPKGTLLPVPVIAQAYFREAMRLREGESKPDFLKRARTVLLGMSVTET